MRQLANTIPMRMNSQALAVQAPGRDLAANRPAPAARGRLLCRQLGWLVLLGLLGSVAGCAVGPDYARPALPASRAYTPASTEAALPAATASAPVPGGAAQRFVTAEVQADWWRLFKSTALNAVVARAFAANPSIEAAQAAIGLAQENVAAQQGFFLPTVQAGYAPTRSKIAGNLGGNSPGVQGDGSVISTSANTPASQGGTAPFNRPVIYNFHTAQLTVGYVPDLFGANQRQVESLQAQAAYQRFQLQATYLTLASNVVAAAIQEAMLRDQITSTQAVIDSNLQALTLVQRQKAAGYASRLDVALQDNALAQARQALPGLEKQLDLTRDLLRALLGLPQDSDLPETFALAALSLPEDLPLSLPSQLVEQRPDVRAAEAQLQMASAQVGVALAARLPQFAINAGAGGAAANFGQMFWGSGRFFSLGLDVTQQIFDGGTLLHRQRGAEQALRQAAAQYRSTALTAFQNVADSLHAIEADARALAAAAEVERTAAVALSLVRHQLARGYVDRLVLLGAERAWQQAVMARSQAHASRLGDTVALFQALGGGWWGRDAAEPALAADSMPGQAN